MVVDFGPRATARRRPAVKPRRAIRPARRQVGLGCHDGPTPLPDRGRVARPRAGGHDRGRPGRAAHHGRPDRGGPGAAPARLRPWRAQHVDRAGPRRDSARASATASRSARRSCCSSAIATGRTGRASCRSSRSPPSRPRSWGRSPRRGDKKAAPITRLRAGHADLAGAVKYGFDDVRNILERASARETAARVAAGAVARALLAEFGIDVWSYTAEVGGDRHRPRRSDPPTRRSRGEPAALPGPRRRGADDRPHRRGAQRRRHRRRRVRGSRDRRPDRARQPRPVGSPAGRGARRAPW